MSHLSLPDEVLLLVIYEVSLDKYPQLSLYRLLRVNQRLIGIVEPTLYRNVYLSLHSKSFELFMHNVTEKSHLAPHVDRLELRSPPSSWRAEHRAFDAAYSCAIPLLQRLSYLESLDLFERIDVPYGNSCPPGPPTAAPSKEQPKQAIRCEGHSLPTQELRLSCVQTRKGKESSSAIRKPLSKL